MATVIELSDFRKTVKAKGYTCRVRRVSFEGLGYGVGHFLILLKDGKKIVGGIGTQSHWENFDVQYPDVRRWWQEFQVVDGNQKIIFDK